MRELGVSLLAPCQGFLVSVGLSHLNFYAFCFLNFTWDEGVDASDLTKRWLLMNRSKQVWPLRHLKLFNEAGL